MPTPGEQLRTAEGPGDASPARMSDPVRCVPLPDSPAFQEQPPAPRGALTRMVMVRHGAVRLANFPRLLPRRRSLRPSRVLRAPVAIRNYYGRRGQNLAVTGHFSRNDPRLYT